MSPHQMAAYPFAAVLKRPISSPAVSSLKGHVRAALFRIVVRPEEQVPAGGNDHAVGDAPPGVDS